MIVSNKSKKTEKNNKSLNSPKNLQDFGRAPVNILRILDSIIATAVDVIWADLFS